MERSPAFTRAHSRLAYVLQGRGLFSHLTVHENLPMGLPALSGRETAKKEIPALIYDLFPILHDLAGRRVGNLSGGQQQVAIGRALVTQPRYLLLDEPTEGIQPSIVQDIERALMEFNARNPAQRLIAVYMVYNAPLHAILVLKSSGIKTPRDLEGKTLAAPVGDASRRLFPDFAEANGIDASKVKWLSMDGGLREPMLARKQADGIAGFTFTSLLSLGQLGLKAGEVTVFRYAASIGGLYGNASMVRADWAKKTLHA